MEIFKEIVGYSATIVGTSIMLPQVYKTFKTKTSKDISWGMLVLYFLNCLLWLVYGFLIFSNPLILTNGIALIISSVQILFKVKYK